MKKRHIHAFHFLLAAGIACGIAQDSSIAKESVDTAAAYIKKPTWAETMTASRSKLIKIYSKTGTASTAPCFRPYDSGLMKGNGQGKSLSVNISGLKILRLVGDCVEGPANCNIWGEPKLIAKDGTETRLTSLKPVLA